MSNELPTKRRFTELEAELEIDADMLMDRLSAHAQVAEGVKSHTLWLSSNEACFLYRCAQVFRNE